MLPANYPSTASVVATLQSRVGHGGMSERVKVTQPVNHQSGDLFNARPAYSMHERHRATDRQQQHELNCG